MFSFGLFMYLIYGGFIAICLYGLYFVLSSLLDRYLVAKRDQTAALREQNQALKEITSAIRESNYNSGTPQEIV